MHDCKTHTIEIIKTGLVIIPASIQFFPSMRSFCLAQFLYFFLFVFLYEPKESADIVYLGDVYT